MISGWVFFVGKVRMTEGEGQGWCGKDAEIRVFFLSSFSLFVFFSSFLYLILRFSFFNVGTFTGSYTAPKVQPHGVVVKLTRNN